MGDSQEFDRVYERFQLIVNGPALFNAVITALELDVLPFISRHPGVTFEELHRHVGIESHKLRVLMLALCATELVERHDGLYANSQFAEDHLVTDSPEGWRDTLIGWRRFQYPAFPHMTAALRTGTNEAALASYPEPGNTLYDRLANDPELVANYHDSIGPFTHLFAHALLDNAEIAEVGRLLDVGGGDGTTAIKFVRRYANATVTIFDMPSVCRHAESGLPDDVKGRVLTHPGDIFDDDFPSGFDGILFSHSMEVFSPEHNVKLLTKAYKALPPGGKIFLYNMCAPDDENSGLLSARLSLFLNVLASGEGMTYPPKDYERWLTEVGCRSVRSYTGLPYEHALVVGVKG
ncbi:methyltransferase [Streptomyces pseudovenezuelae]|uniref:methyltransferase n=1 Tax=Streptomyces pseudovenezuelae TaxID=67350 RepID=UPI0036EBC40F